MKLFCSNCNKYGHNYKNCTEPILSNGMIIFNLEKDIKNKIIKELFFKNNEELNDYNYKRINNLKKINFYKNKIKFLIIEKKHSLNYIEFIRGLYDINDSIKIEKMFMLMSNKEIINIKKNNFINLWNNLWNETANLKIYKKEFYKSLNKFNFLKDSGKLKELVLIKSKYNSPEWELPKGKIINKESNLDCAIREIYEETTLTKEKYNLLSNSFSIQDTFYGTNNIKYKNNFYLSILKEDTEIKITDNKEVNNIKFITINEIPNYIRDYNQNTSKLLLKVFLFILNKIEDNHNLNLYV